MRLDKKDLLLYAVSDRHWLGDSTLYTQIEQAVMGGATCVQLREKEMDSVSLYSEAVEIQKLCSKHAIPFIINDNVDMACRIKADGVHVGQSDMEAGRVREMIGKNKILGVSAQTVEQAVLAQAQGADYLGVGAVFYTDSKSDAAVVSIETLKNICAAVSIPVIAIGGINKNNVMKLKNCGISGIAVISAIFAEKNIKKAAMELKSLALNVTGD